jgi:hypothetical protein
MMSGSQDRLASLPPHVRGDHSSCFEAVLLFELLFRVLFESEFLKTVSTLIAFSKLFSNGTTALLRTLKHWSDAQTRDTVAQFFCLFYFCSDVMREREGRRIGVRWEVNRRIEYHCP